MLVCGTFLLSPGTSLEASERRFRLKIPNPIPRIVDRIEKVSDFVGRTARRVGRADEDDERRRNPPPIPEPLSPPTEDTIVVRPGDPRRLERKPLPPMRGENARPAIVRSPGTQQSPTPSKIVVVSPLAGRDKKALARETAALAAYAARSRPIASDPTPAISAASPSITHVSKPIATAPPPEAIPEPASLAFGRAVPGRPGIVYPPGVKAVPENRVDVRGLTPGTKVRDPSTGQIFLVP